MKWLLTMLAVLGLAAPALADEQKVPVQPAVLDDAALDQVAAGCDTHGTTGAVAPVTNNINISPIIVTQTSVAVNNQRAANNAGKGHGKGANKQSIRQDATAVAMNVANINYTVKF